MKVQKMILMTLVLTVLLAMPGVRASAQPVVSVTSASGHPGDEVEIAVSTKGMSTVTAAQLSIELPAALTYVDGSAVLGKDVVAGSHQLQVTQTDNQLKIYVYSMKLDSMKDSEGQLLTFRLLLGDEPQTYTLTPVAVLSNASGGAVRSTVQSGKVTIQGAKLQLSTTAVHFEKVPIGSTHQQSITVSNPGNESLSITGAESTLSHVSLQGIPCTVAPSGSQTLTVSYAPLQAGTESATITIASNATGRAPVLTVDGEPYSVNKLIAKCTTDSKSGEISVSVDMQNMDPIVAVQCVFLLPEALSYVDGSAQLSSQRSGGGHELSHSLSDGKLSLFIHSSENAAIAGQDGELFSFRLQPVGASGNYSLNPTDVILSNSAGENVVSSTDGAQVHLSSPQLEAGEQLDFGRVPMGTTTKNDFVVKNVGEKPLVISRIEMDDEAFAVTNTLPIVIEAGRSAVLDVAYTPSGEGAHETAMKLYSNDPDHALWVVQLSANAQYINVVTLKGGPVPSQQGQYALTLGLDNTLPITALQADIKWIPGMTTSSEQVELLARAASHQAVITPVTAGVYRLFVYSENNQTISVGNGDLLTIKYNKEKQGKEIAGTTITVDNLILSGVDEQNHASSTQTTLVVSNKLRGDVNGDGLVTVSDVTAVIDFLLERHPQGITLSAADVTGDGQVTISDVVDTIQLILYQ